VDPELLALLARLGELSADELTELAARLTAAGAAVDVSGDVTPEQAEQLEAVADGLELVRAEETRRVELAEAETAAAAAAEEAAAAERAATAERATAARARLGLPEPGAEPDPASDAPPPADPDPVTAGARRTGLGNMAGSRRIANVPAVETPTGPRVTTALVAAADVRGFPMGAALANLDELGQAFVNKLRGFTGASGEAGHREAVVVASLATTYPDTHRMLDDDPRGNAERLEALEQDEALVAAGGICGPLPVDYAIPEVGDLDRPVRNSMARVEAPRGGIRTNVPPLLTQADAGFGIWTLANDEEPGSDGPLTKPIVEFECGQHVESFVYAATYRARYSNIRARFSPEEVASNARMGLVSHARLAELQLLAQMYGKATAVTAGSLLGASKDFFATLDVVTAHMRYRQRRTRTQPIRIWLPSWVLDMLRADFVRQMPAGDVVAQYAVADAAMETMLRARNVNVTWTIEDADGLLPGGIGVAQATGAILNWPNTVRWLAAYEGDLVFLDGGELDLGVVRDSALNASNRYESFYESFEGVHLRGSERPLLVEQTLNPNGSAAGLVATATGNAAADL